jgi:hypothetical protein
MTERGEAMEQDSREIPLDLELVEKAYARWAPVYDVVFGAVFALGRAAAIRAAERVGGRILEVGVGTGISASTSASRCCARPRRGSPPSSCPMWSCSR